MSRVIKSNLALKLSIPNFHKNKTANDQPNIDNILSLDVRHAELFVILGRTRSGKSQILRTIAGFANIGKSSVQLYGEDIRFRKPTERPVNLVFPKPSLFPHLTVAENIGFGLEQLRRPHIEIRKVVHDLLKRTNLESLANRRPHQLDDSEKQMVSIMRAIAPSPRLLLLDEPLERLDFEARQRIRELLRLLQTESEITLIVATQDREFALGSADKIAVLENGQVSQISTPEDVYYKPKNEHVARISGEINILSVKVLSVQDNIAFCQLGNDNIITLHQPLSTMTEGNTQLLVRPESITVTDLSPDVEGHIEIIEFRGSQCLLYLDCGKMGLIRAAFNPNHGENNFKAGQKVGLKFHSDFHQLIH